jgi:D-beta-D-heptose 7-phosphate kinase / D-beta-D-heptose 1-phosphate adenosyltransferase
MKNQTLKEFLKRNQQKRLNIHCVGDAMVDEYYKVKVNRISPEHPVPVMVCQNEVVRKPGGSANVSYQLKHLNVETKLVCFHDPSAANVFLDHNICCLNSSSNFSCTLPIKRRYLDNGIQVAPRHDFERPLCGLTPDQIDLFSKDFFSTTSQHKPDVAILSDYDKGFFNSSQYKIIDYYKDVITIVDPKKGPVEKWKGCTIFKPNSKEAAEISGKNTWQEQAKFFKQELGCEAVVITFGGEKVVGISGNDFFEFVPTKKVLVESVIGAGDCFAAFFATAIGHGFNPVESAEIAWEAGSVYVQQRMNRPVVPAELSPDKIVSPKDLRERDFKLVFTNGCFDILHKGHIETLKFAKSKGDKLVVALNTDESIKSFKDKSRPVVPLEHRMAVISSIQYVDFVVSFDEDTPIKAIESIMPDVLVKGDGYQIKDVVGFDLVPEVCIAPSVEQASTTKFVEEWAKRKSINEPPTG